MAAADMPASSAGASQSGVRYVEASEGDAGQRLDNFLLRVFKAVPKSHVYRVLRKGEVRVNGKRAKPETRLVLGDRVRIPPIRIDAEPSQGKPSGSLQSFISAAIIHEDRDLLIINKPSGVAVHGGSGLAFGVIEALRAARPELTELELVHRLDRDTSGVLVLAKRRAALREMHAALREREMTKRYLALVCGKWTLGKKTLELPLLTNQKQGGERMVRVHPEGQSAHSVFMPKQHFGKLATLMDIEIGTGRTHQIRVHAAYAGHPVAGDEKYGDKQCNDSLRPFGLKRMFLHAQSLQFVKPGTTETFTITAPLSDELQEVLNKLEEAAGKKSRR
ncbi:MAG TPA: RluA family pseudouridine synthase [Steroidobacteraceae bacterium]|nr:RluA family pseudouridine synthase [Steroidobacteraceae bacterium]